MNINLYSLTLRLKPALAYIYNLIYIRQWILALQPSFWKVNTDDTTDALCLAIVHMHNHQKESHREKGIIRSHTHYTSIPSSPVELQKRWCIDWTTYYCKCTMYHDLPYYTFAGHTRSATPTIIHIHIWWMMCPEVQHFLCANSLDGSQVPLKYAIFCVVVAQSFPWFMYDGLLKIHIMNRTHTCITIATVCMSAVRMSYVSANSRVNKWVKCSLF